MVKKMELRDEKYSGMVGILILEEDKSLYIEVKDSKTKQKKIIKLNDALLELGFVA